MNLSKNNLAFFKYFCKYSHMWLFQLNIIERWAVGIGSGLLYQSVFLFK